MWEELLTISHRPPARGFHASILLGYRIFLVGGQGSMGVGRSSVLSDSWQLDVYTGVWKQLPSSDAAPVASHFILGSLSDGSRAICFGGLNKDSAPLAHLSLFDAAGGGWSTLKPVGERPPARCGHVAAIDTNGGRMIISLGVGSHCGDDTIVCGDTWALHLATSHWQRLHVLSPRLGFSAGAGVEGTV